jgi:hypothetical protein
VMSAAKVSRTRRRNSKKGKTSKKQRLDYYQKRIVSGKRKTPLLRKQSSGRKRTLRKVSWTMLPKGKRVKAVTVIKGAEKEATNGTGKEAPLRFEAPAKANPGHIIDLNLDLTHLDIKEEPGIKEEPDIKKEPGIKEEPDIAAEKEVKGGGQKGTGTGCQIIVQEVGKGPEEASLLAKAIMKLEKSFTQANKDLLRKSLLPLSTPKSES